MLEQRARVAPLALDVPLLRIDGREPGPAAGKASGGGRVPLHRVPERVAARAVERRVAAGPVGEPDLVALVDERGTGERQQQRGRVAHMFWTDPRGETGEVVVREHPGHPPE